MANLLARLRQALFRTWNPPRYQGAFLAIESIHLARAYYVAAELGLADLLAERPQTCAELAAAVGADERELRRMLQVLAAFRIFRCDRHGVYSNTSRAKVLQSDVPGSLRAWIQLIGSPALWQAFACSLDSVKTGTHPFRLAHGRDFYEYLTDHEPLRQAFLSAMDGWTHWQASVLVREFAFGDYRRIIDIGGGMGSLLAAILRQHPHVQGVLFDQPDTIARASQAFADSDLAARLEFVAGSFLESIPPGGDAYTLKHVLRDWDDDQAVTILTRCRRAMSPESVLLVIDAVVDERTGRDRLVKLVDLEIGALQAGRLRTRAELEELLQRAGLRIQRIVWTNVADSPVIVAQVDQRFATTSADREQQSGKTSRQAVSVTEEE